MKKLLMMAVVIGATFAAQAVTWNFVSGNRIMSGFDKSAPYKWLGAGYNVYIIAADFFNSTPIDSTKAKLITQDTFLSRVRNGQTLSQAAGDSLLASTVTDEKSNFSISGVAIDDPSYYYNVGYGAADTLYAILAVEGVDAVFISEVVGTSVIASDSNEMSFWATTSLTDNFADETGNAAWSDDGWYAVIATDTPEPTSALLLLFGMAGLALKRKRA